MFISDGYTWDGIDIDEEAAYASRDLPVAQEEEREDVRNALSRLTRHASQEQVRFALLTRLLEEVQRIAPEAWQSLFERVDNVKQESLVGHAIDDWARDCNLLDKRKDICRAVRVSYFELWRAARGVPFAKPDADSSVDGAVVDPVPPVNEVPADAPIVVTIAEQRFIWNPAHEPREVFERQVWTTVKSAVEKQLHDLPSYAVPEIRSVRKKSMLHLTWFVRYQVLGHAFNAIARDPLVLALLEVQEKAQYERAGIQARVKELADTLQIQLRPQIKGGRPSNSKTKSTSHQRVKSDRTKRL